MSLSVVTPGQWVSGKGGTSFKAWKANAVDRDISAAKRRQISVTNYILEYSGHFCHVIEIDRCNFQLYRFKVGAFFETQSV